MPKKPDRDRKKAEKTSPTKAAAAAQTIPVSSLISQILNSIRGAAATLPPKPLPAGTVGAEVPINAPSLQKLIAAVAAEDGTGGQQVWTKDASELTIITGKVAIALDDGLAVVTVLVSCDQLAGASIQVPFAMGGKDSPSGMVFATEDRPRGPEAIVDLWGEALTAYAWRLLVTVMHRITLQSGTDEDGAGLVPIAVTATKEGITLVPIARHTFDRVRL